METVLQDLGALVRRHVRGSYSGTGIPRLSLSHESGTGHAGTGMVRPSLCLTVQGAKRVGIGPARAGECFVSSVDVPASFEVIEASPPHPYLGLSLSLDPGIVGEILLEMSDVESWSIGPGLGVGRADPALLDACLRLLRTLDAPDDSQILAPLAEREILFRLLKGPSGGRVRQLCRTDAHLPQIRRAVTWLQENYATSVRVEDMAGLAGMSGSAFHRHFKAVTSMTPIQYRMRLRLHEARRMLLAGPGAVARAAYAVGYESVSQFSRDYGRLFGAPPVRDLEVARAAMAQPREVRLSTFAAPRDITDIAAL